MKYRAEKNFSCNGVRKKAGEVLSKEDEGIIGNKFGKELIDNGLIGLNPTKKDEKEKAEKDKAEAESKEKEKSEKAKAEKDKAIKDKAIKEKAKAEIANK